MPAPTPTPTSAPTVTPTPALADTPTAISAVPSQTASANNRTVSGALFDSNGHPIAGYVVELHSDPMTTVTDVNGRYTFYYVDYTNHDLIIKTPEGEKKLSLSWPSQKGRS